MQDCELTTCQSIGLFHTKRRTNRLPVCSTNVNSRRPTPLISRQISHKQSLLLLVPFPRDGQIDQLFVSARLSVNLDRTLVVLFVGKDKSSSKNRLHRRSNRRTNSNDEVIENFFFPFPHQTICPSETVCPYMYICGKK